MARTTLQTALDYAIVWILLIVAVVIIVGIGRGAIDHHKETKLKMEKCTPTNLRVQQKGGRWTQVYDCTELNKPSKKLMVGAEQREAGV